MISGAPSIRNSDRFERPDLPSALFFARTGAAQLSLVFQTEFDRLAPCLVGEQLIDPEHGRAEEGPGLFLLVHRGSPQTIGDEQQKRNADQNGE